MYFLGTVSGASGAYSNQQTGVSGMGAFGIPIGTRAIYLVPGVSGIQFEMFGVSGGSGFTSQTTAARGAHLNGLIVNGPFRCITQQTLVSVYNSAGGFFSVRVYASGQS